MSTVDPQSLMRYADNELSLPERRLVEDQLRGDPDAKALLATFQAQRDQLKAALAGEDDGLERYELAIDRALEKRRRDRRQAEIRRWALPLAASLLITVIGGFASVHYADRRAQSETARLLAAQAAELAKDRELALETRLEALERQISGSTLTWSNEASGTEGAVTPLRTFRTPSGQWCREYREITTFDGNEEERLSIACRNDGRGWAAPEAPGPT